MLSTFAGTSQVIFSKYTVYFESGKYVVTKLQKQRLDSFIVSLSNIPEAFEISVKGHTDNKGSLEINEPLSKNRSKEVLNYLQKKGFKTTDSSLSYFAYNKPAIENTEENLWKNRRVEIVVYSRKFSMAKLLDVKDFGPERFTLNEDSGGVVKSDSTTLTISPNSFLNADGSAVSGNITITYQKYEGPVDFLLGDIPMTTGSGHNMLLFESGGMFKILANQKGNPLKLKGTTDKQISIEMPLKKIPDQNFYRFDSLDHHWVDSGTPVTDANGNIIPPNINSTDRDAGGKNSNLYIYPNCITGTDTCLYFEKLFLKMKYYLTHKEPLLANNPYKSVKNNVTDYQSPFYKITADTVKHTCRFAPINSYNELGAFSNYEWHFDDTDFNDFRISERNYATFIKITYEGSGKFQIKMNKASEKTKIYNVTGKSTAFHLFTRAEKINAKNNKKYLKELYDFDAKEVVNDNDLKSKTGLIASDDLLLNDSLECFRDFYVHFLLDSAEAKYIRLHGDFYNYFNVNKDKILAKFQQKKALFDCEAYKKRVGRMSKIEKARIATMATFGITKLGIFNADAVKRIPDPDYITADYKDKKTKKDIKIITIFLNVQGLNGLIRYDGHYGYGPYKFAFGKQDKCVLIAVDEDFNPYYVSPEDFKTAISRKTGDRVTFFLIPTGNLNSKENVENILLK
ncbi:MAG: OmpA family protein [Bacteroidota bacterium]